MIFEYFFIIIVLIQSTYSSDPLMLNFGPDQKPSLRNTDIPYNLVIEKLFSSFLLTTKADVIITGKKDIEQKTGTSEHHYKLSHLKQSLNQKASINHFLYAKNFFYDKDNTIKLLSCSEIQRFSFLLGGYFFKNIFSNMDIISKSSLFPCKILHFLTVIQKRKIPDNIKNNLQTEDQYCILKNQIIITNCAKFDGFPQKDVFKKENSPDTYSRIKPFFVQDGKSYEKKIALINNLEIEANAFITSLDNIKSLDSLMLLPFFIPLITSYSYKTFFDLCWQFTRPFSSDHLIKPIVSVYTTLYYNVLWNKKIKTAEQLKNLMVSIVMNEDSKFGNMKESVIKAIKTSYSNGLKLKETIIQEGITKLKNFDLAFSNKNHTINQINQKQLSSYNTDSIDSLLPIIIYLITALEKNPIFLHSFFNYLPLTLGKLTALIIGCLHGQKCLIDTYDNKIDSYADFQNCELFNLSNYELFQSLVFINLGFYMGKEVTNKERIHCITKIILSLSKKDLIMFAQLYKSTAKIEFFDSVQKQENLQKTLSAVVFDIQNQCPETQKILDSFLNDTISKHKIPINNYYLLKHSEALTIFKKYFDDLIIQSNKKSIAKKNF